MAIEPKRACGYRKVGAIYLAGPLTWENCHCLPIKLSVCPTCNAGIRQTRGWTWVDPVGLLMSPCQVDRRQFPKDYFISHCLDCPVCTPTQFGGDHVGLLWVGEKFYDSPKDFFKEAVELGVSKKLSAIPKGFVLGVDYVFLAHPMAIEGNNPPDYSMPEPGIFLLWKPERIEKIITETMSRDNNLMGLLASRGIQPVIVPDDDPDHNPKGE